MTRSKQTRNSSSAIMFSTTQQSAALPAPFAVADSAAQAPLIESSGATVRIVFAISGQGSLLICRQQVAVSSGTIVTIPAGMSGRSTLTQLARTVALCLPPEYVQDQLRWLSAAHPLVRQLRSVMLKDAQLQKLQLPPSTMRILAPPLARLATLARTAGGEFALIAALSTVFDVIGHIAERPTLALGIGAADDGVCRAEVQRAIELMRAHPTRRWNVDDLAAQVSLSRSQLGRLFRDQLGTSPAAYLAQTRAALMAELLSTRHIGVLEAARAVGWDDPSVASRAFKRHYGVSPSRYAAGIGAGRQHG